MAEARIEIILSNGARAGDTLKELTKQANSLNKEIKDLKPGTAEFAAKAKDLQAVSARMDDIKKQVKGTTEASNALKDSFTRFVPFAGQFSQLGANITGVKGSVGGLTSGFGLLRGAIIATGIGALVVLLTSLVMWFTKTEEGADKLKSVLYPLQVLFERVKGIVAELGGKIFKRLSEAFDDPIQAIKDLGQAILDNILNRFKAFSVLGDGIVKLLNGQFKEGFKTLADGVIQMGTGITNATDKMNTVFQETAKIWNEASKEGQKLLDLENAIEDAEVALTIARAKSNVEFAKQMEIARDVTKSDKERLEAAKAAIAIQDNLLAQEENFLSLKLQRLKIEQDQDRILTDDERLERAKMEADLIQLQADNIDKKKKSAAIVHSIELEQIKATEAAWKEYYKALDELDKLHLESQPESREKDLALLQDSLRRQIEALDQNAPFYADRVAAAQELARQKRDEVNSKWDVTDTTKKITALENELLAEQNLLEQQYLSRQITAAQFAQLTLDNSISFQEQKLELVKKNNGEESQEYQKAFSELLKLRQQKADNEIAIEESKQQKIDKAINASFQVTAGFFGSLASLQQQGSEQYKKFAIAQAVISAIGAAQNAYKSTAAIDYVGPILAPFAAATALAAGYAQVQNIRNTPVPSPAIRPKAEKGGYLRGARHAQGGIDINAEDGEFIFSRSAVNAIGLSRLTAMNNRFTRATGGPVNPFEYARQAAANSGTTGGSQDILNLAPVVNEIRALTEAMDRRIDRLEVYNDVSKTQKGIQTLNKLEADATV